MYSRSIQYILYTVQYFGNRLTLSIFGREKALSQYQEYVVRSLF